MIDFLLTAMGLCFCPNDDKIEKKGTLLNSTCTSFGTRCSAGSSSSVIQYSYWVNESGARLILSIPEKEAIKNNTLFNLLNNKTSLTLNETLVLPNEVCSSLRLSKDYALPIGIYRIKSQFNNFLIYLINE